MESRNTFLSVTLFKIELICVKIRTIIRNRSRKRETNKGMLKKETMRYCSSKEFWKLFQKDKNNASDEIELDIILIICKIA